MYGESFCEWRGASARAPRKTARAEAPRHHGRPAEGVEGGLGLPRLPRLRCWANSSSMPESTASTSQIKRYMPWLVAVSLFMENLDANVSNRAATPEVAEAA